MKRLDHRSEIARIPEDEFEQMKEDVRWDIAWKIFDQINLNLNCDMEINLNCLDIDEAQAIAKQKIYDVAQIAQMESQKNRYEEAKQYVLIILCSSDHITFRSPFDIPDTDIEDEQYAYSRNQKSTSGSSGDNFGITQSYYSKNDHNKRRNPQRRRDQGTNHVLDMIKNELKLDHFYIENTKIILVKIDDQTLNNPELANW